MKALPDNGFHDDGIRANGVTVTYRNGHTALRKASFAVPSGTLAALLGVNGSGKSTLFKALMGLVPLAEGDITMMGMPPCLALRQSQVAYVPQAEDVDWHFPVLAEDVVMMGRYGHMGALRIPRKADHNAVAAALDRVGMRDFRHRQIGELSGGKRNAFFSPGPSPRAGKLCCWTNRLPVSMSIQSDKLFLCFSKCAMRAAHYSFPLIISPR